MPKVTRLLCFAGIVCLGAVFTADARAGAFLDWLFHRRTATNYCPTTALYPTVTAANPGAQVCQRVTASYAPYTTYRTTWAQVPVTYFRPVSGTDPATGCPVTSMQPCTTYTWQVRRVPILAYRPVYQTVAMAPTITTTVAQPVVTAPAAASCGCAAQSMAPAMQVIPGAGMTVTQGALPQGAVPYGIPPNTGQPGNGPATVPGAAAPATGGTTPADVPPALDNGSMQTYPQNPLLGYPPVVNPSERSVLNYPSATAPPTNRATGNGNLLQPHSGQASPNVQPPPDNGARNAPRGYSTPARLYDLTPIPDPDVPETESRSFDAPQLLNPRDKTAQRPVRQTWAYTTITWNKPAESTAAPSAEQPATPSRNDHGWRSQGYRSR